jgi:hypothetical protein
MNMQPGDYVLAALVCAGIGCVAFLGAGLVTLATAIRNAINPGHDA